MNKWLLLLLLLQQWSMVVKLLLDTGKKDRHMFVDLILVQNLDRLRTSQSL